MEKGLGDTARYLMSDLKSGGIRAEQIRGITGYPGKDLAPGVHTRTTKAIARRMLPARTRGALRSLYRGEPRETRGGRHQRRSSN